MIKTYIIILCFCLSILPRVKQELINKERWKELRATIASAISNNDNLTSVLFFDQIDKDLLIWKSRGGISNDEFNKALTLNKGVHYQVIDHKLYRHEHCAFPRRCKGNEHFLLKIIKDLPDMEMIINTHDWPKSSRHSTPLPIMSFSKTPEEFDMLYPAWTFWAGGPAIRSIYPSGLGRWDIHRKEIMSSALDWPWHKKDKKAFFRGSRTSSERDRLILLSRKEPGLVDASYTKNQSWRSNKDTLGQPPATEISLKDHCQYRYLFNFRGVAASFRLKHLFLCNSLVFHVGDQWIEFFYPELKPWVHYIPVKQNLSDARKLIEFASENEDIAKDIADRGRDFIEKNLKLEHIEDYWRHLLFEYSSLLLWKPERDYSLIEVLKSHDEL